MGKHIVIIQGHPDSSEPHFCHALADAYAEGAESAGHRVRRIDVAELDFPLLRSQADFEGGEVPDSLRPAQDALRWAEHVVLVYPLWLGTLPALLKGFLEQVLRPELVSGGTGSSTGGMKGRSARVIVTMGMPGIIYKLFFRAHSLKSLERNVLRFIGFRPVRHSLIGMVEDASEAKHKTWLAEMRSLGTRSI